MKKKIKIQHSKIAFPSATATKKFTTLKIFNLLRFIPRYQFMKIYLMKSKAIMCFFVFFNFRLYPIFIPLINDLAKHHHKKFHYPRQSFPKANTPMTKGPPSTLVHKCTIICNVWIRIQHAEELSVNKHLQFKPPPPYLCILYSSSYIVTIYLYVTDYWLIEIKNKQRKKYPIYVLTSMLN